MVDLLVQLVQYQIGLMLLGVATRDRAERLLPGRIGQSVQEVSPRVMCLSESGQGPEASGAVASPWSKPVVGWPTPNHSAFRFPP